MSIDTLAREAAQRAQGEIAMVDVPESNAVLSKRRAQHRTRNAVAAALAIVVLGGGAVAAVAATRGDDNKKPDVAVTSTDERLNPDAIDKMHYLYTQGSEFATSADWVHTTVDGKAALLLDVHGQFKLQPPCPNGRDCATYGTNNLLTLDASDGNFDVLDSKVSDKATDLSAYGHVNHVMLPLSHLEFREVVGALPWDDATSGAGGDTCKAGSALTPAKDITPEATQIVLSDLEPHQICYVVGPSVLDRPNIEAVRVQRNPVATNEWQLLVHFGDDSFVQEIAGPMVGKNVAIVANNVVWSAPTINQGITGRDVQITGNFTQEQANALAAGLGFPQSASAPLPQPKATFQAAQSSCSESGGLLGQTPVPPECSRQLTTSVSASNADVVSARAVQENGAWAVQLGLKPEVASRFATDAQISVLGLPSVDRADVAGDTLTLSALSPLQGLTKAQAEQLASDLNP